jgi:hypothetical protein
MNGEAAKVALAAGLAGREGFLAAAIAAMVVCGLAGFALAGRASPRTQAALALLGVLIGGFALLVLFGPSAGRNPLFGGFILAGLVGLFKLMNQFEIQRRTTARRPDSGSDRAGRRL